MSGPWHTGAIPVAVGESGQQTNQESRESQAGKLIFGLIFGFIFRLVSRSILTANSYSTAYTVIFAAIGGGNLLTPSNHSRREYNNASAFDHQRLYAP
jgi:hypothetical protein